LQQWGGLLNAAAILIFLVNNVRTVRYGVGLHSLQKVNSLLRFLGNKKPGHPGSLCNKWEAVRFPSLTETSYGMLSARIKGR
jgi:hypothetical protein